MFYLMLSYKIRFININCCSSDVDVLLYYIDTCMSIISIILNVICVGLFLNLMFCNIYQC